MADGISFVLHAAADEAYATALAGGLGALPLKLEPGRASSLQFGQGVVCIVVWSEALRPQSEALLGALSSGVVQVVRTGDAALPDAWARFDVIDARDAEADAETLAAISQTHRVAAFDRSAQLQGAAGGHKQRFAARSAYGMAATLAVASLVTPFIMDRAQATDASGAGLLPPSAPAQGAGLLRASLAALSAPAEDVVEAAPTATPALDRWLAESAEDAFADAAPALAEPMLVAFTADAAPMALTSVVESAVDPKREAFHAAIDNAGKADGFAFEPVNTAKNV